MQDFNTPITADQSVSGFIPSDGAGDYQSRWAGLSPCATRSRYALLVAGERYGRRWMLKALKPELRDDVAYRLMLRKEFETMAALLHPNIVTTTGWEQVEGLGPCIVMEWIDGVPLDEWLESRPRRSQRLRVASQLIDALAYIHSKQMVHRDLKPQNVMITRNGCNVKLIDFGLADLDSSVVMKVPAGTRGYSDPEQDRQTNALNDIYSLGRLLQMLHLGLAYRGICRKCCCPQRRRYPSMDAVKQAMRRAVWLPKAAVLLAAVAALGASFAYAAGQQASKPEQPVAAAHGVTMPTGDSTARVADSAPQGKIATIVSDTASHHEAVAAPAPVPSAMKGNQDSRQLLQEKIKNGKALIDRIAAPVNERYLTLEVSYEEQLKAISKEQTDFCNKLWDEVEAYCNSQPLSDPDRSTLLRVLNDYGFNHYTLPWFNRYEEQRRLLKAQ